MSYTDVSICNLALTHLGDKAAVTSISAPTTAQETYCATYYPIARDLTLDEHTWSFTVVRGALSESADVDPPSTWQYCYEMPSGIVRLLAVLDPNAADDNTAPMNFTQVDGATSPMANLGIATPYPFVVEYDSTHTKRVIYTNIEDAVARYTISVTDPAKFANDFVMSVSYRLASFLAGPIIKGDVAIKLIPGLEAQAEKWLMRAKNSDASERRVPLASGAPWITGR